MNSGAAPTVTVVIPHHNGPRLLRESLGSLRDLRYDRKRLRVSVVDDASTDGSVAVLGREFPQATVLRNETNLGFAAACNRGAREADSDWIALLNNDTRVDPGWLEALVAAVDPGTGVMAAASKILDWEGGRVAFQGGYLNFVGKGFEDACPRGAAGEITEPRNLLFASGCAMLVHRTTFLELGGFDEEFFGFYEDTDFGWRLCLAGYETRLAPHSIVYHRGHASFDAAGNRRRLALIERNALWQMVKNLGDRALHRILPAALFLAFRRSEILEGGFFHGRRKLLRETFQALLEGKPVEGYGRTILSACAGMIDGMAGVLGKREEVQRLRKVPDDRILTKEFFPDPFRVWSLDSTMEALLTRGGYAGSVREAVEAFRIGEIFPYAPPPSG